MSENDVSAKALGEWLDVSDRTIRELAERGIAVRTGRGRYDLKQSVINHTRHLREVSAGRGGENQILDLTAERARESKERADNLALKNEQLRGELLHVDDVVRNWQDILRRVSSSLLSVPERVAARRSVDADIVQAFDREIRDTLNDLADDEDGSPARLEQPAPADEATSERVG
jgi:phage terminase Nu1 subunit (DNA packaging protein)